MPPSASQHKSLTFHCFLLVADSSVIKVHAQGADSKQTLQGNSATRHYLPVTETGANDERSGVRVRIITDCSPDAVEVDFQASFRRVVVRGGWIRIKESYENGRITYLYKIFILGMRSNSELFYSIAIE